VPWAAIRRQISAPVVSTKEPSAPPLGMAENAGLDIAGLDNDGLDNGGQENQDWKT